MKKTHFLVAALFANIFVLPLAAQEGDNKENLLVNSGFEDTNFGLFDNKDLADYEISAGILGSPTLVLGWDTIENPTRTDDFNNIGLNKYVVAGKIGKYPVLKENDNQQYFRIQQYIWFGDASQGGTSESLADGGLQQTINVEPSTVYTLSFQYRLSNHAENGRLVPCSFSIQEDGKDAESKKLFNELDEQWHDRQQTFTTSATAKKLKIRLYISAKRIQTWGGNVKQWADFDNVSFSKVGPASIENPNQQLQEISYHIENQQVILKGIDNTKNINVYDISGKHLIQMKPANESETIGILNKGIYIIDNGSQRKPLKCIVQ